MVAKRISEIKKQNKRSGWGVWCIYGILADQATRYVMDH